jgi:hypothetical protein
MLTDHRSPITEYDTLADRIIFRAYRPYLAYMDIVTILGYLFLLIFAATAVLAVLSIPKWIEIDEWYRKRLFMALILEVIGVVIILFNKYYIDQDISGPLNHTLSQDNWIALNSAAEIIQPELAILSGRDTTLKITLGQEQLEGSPNWSSVLNGNGLAIQSTNGQSLGQVSTDDLREAGLFNSISSVQGAEVSSRENYTLVKWRKRSGTSWTRSGSYLNDCPFQLEVYDGANGTHYRIRNTETKEMVFRSEDDSRQLFNSDLRINHFFEHNRQFFLMRILEADLFDPNSNYVHILQLRIKPTLGSQE